MPLNGEKQESMTASVNSEEQAVIIYKMNQEIVKFKEDLEKAVEEKKELEDEIKKRNEEIWHINEKNILQEINQSMTDQNKASDLQVKLDKI